MVGEERRHGIRNQPVGLPERLPVGARRIHRGDPGVRRSEPQRTRAVLGDRAQRVREQRRVRAAYGAPDSAPVQHGDAGVRGREPAVPGVILEPGDDTVAGQYVRVGNVRRGPRNAIRDTAREIIPPRGAVVAEQRLRLRQQPRIVDAAEPQIARRIHDQRLDRPDQLPIRGQPVGAKSHAIGVHHAIRAADPHATGAVARQREHEIVIETVDLRQVLPVAAVQPVNPRHGPEPHASARILAHRGDGILLECAWRLDVTGPETCARGRVHSRPESVAIQRWLASSSNRRVMPFDTSAAGRGDERRPAVERRLEARQPAAGSEPQIAAAVLEDGVDLHCSGGCRSRRRTGTMRVRRTLRGHRWPSRSRRAPRGLRARRAPCFSQTRDS